MNTIIQFQKVSKWYGSFQVLDDCTTAVAKGEVVVVCGPSGSGTSTLIKCANGLEPFQQGSVHIDGTAVSDPATDLPRLMPDIRDQAQACRFYTCSHLHEPGGGVRDALTRGDINPSRYRIYTELHAELSATKW